jgi:autotransporter-associated beta strand protein
MNRNRVDHMVWISAAAAIALIVQTTTADAIGPPRFWDSNGTAPGAGTVPTGTWGVNSFWNSDGSGGAGGFSVTYTAGVLYFCAGTDAVGPTTITVSGAQIGRALTFENGDITLSGGTVTVAAKWVTADQNATINSVVAGSGGFGMTGPATLTLGGANIYTGGTTVDGGTLRLGPLAHATVLAPGIPTDATDIQHGKLVFDYDPMSPPSPAAKIHGFLTASYGLGWASGTIYSSTAAGDSAHTHALGWRDDGVMTVTVMYTLYGDSDLNGTVNGADLNVVLSDYNKTGQYWYQGDFNYDGTVNGADLNIVLSNYNQTLGVGAAVPEPATLWLVAAGFAGLLAYGWRKRK